MNAAPNKITICNKFHMPNIFLYSRPALSRVDVWNKRSCGCIADHRIRLGGQIPRLKIDGGGAQREVVIQMIGAAQIGLDSFRRELPQVA